ncbi:hypothetical protein Pcinc_015727 [Petrolisthes cinctipes]|uniref:Uncharacterized protein n=1 Tax=Petrolisthes cinctipes TaxID=88211 RepID=A0AAE1KMT9_PETCI|nr:hypothetical protein Pcinc_015727 [Petrolisthes cinctipes]
MSVSGSYTLATNDKYSEWLSQVGLPADSIAKLVAAKPILEISHNGNTATVKTIAGDKNFTNTITLGQDSKASLPGGIEYTLNMNLSGSTLSGTYNFGGKTGTASVEFTASGANQTMTLGGVTAKRVYTRN